MNHLTSLLKLLPAAAVAAATGWPGALLLVAVIVGFVLRTYRDHVDWLDERAARRAPRATPSDMCVQTAWPSAGRWRYPDHDANIERDAVGGRRGMTSARGTANLALVLRAWLDLVERGDVDALQPILAPDVVWEGLSPELRCDSRDAVLGQMRRGFSSPREFTSIAASAGGDQVIVSVEGPQLREGFGSELQGSAHLVLSLRDGKVVRLRAALTREDALSVESKA